MYEMMNPKIIFTTFAVILGLASCVSTPQSRIAENPSIYNSLTANQQSLVSVGQIEQGMTPPAVFLAWGEPSAVSEGVMDGKQATRWIYSTLEPVFTTPPVFWGGPYWGPYRGPGFYHYYCPYYNDVTYIPVNTGHVLFINGKVKSWEKRR